MKQPPTRLRYQPPTNQATSNAAAIKNRSLMWAGVCMLLTLYYYSGGAWLSSPLTVHNKPMMSATPDTHEQTLVGSGTQLPDYDNSKLYTVQFPKYLHTCIPTCDDHKITNWHVISMTNTHPPDRREKRHDTQYPFLRNPILHPYRWGSRFPHQALIRSISTIRRELEPKQLPLAILRCS